MGMKPFDNMDLVLECLVEFFRLWAIVCAKNFVCERLAGLLVFNYVDHGAHTHTKFVDIPER
jgi:hypothetical protein